jgi:hypothetical protein
MWKHFLLLFLVSGTEGYLVTSLKGKPLKLIFIRIQHFSKNPPLNYDSRAIGRWGWCTVQQTEQIISKTRDDRDTQIGLRTFYKYNLNFYKKYWVSRELRINMCYSQRSSLCLPSVFLRINMNLKKKKNRKEKDVPFQEKFQTKPDKPLYHFRPA